jgi:peptidoglycan/xylan/chitin deacetylase (PgdA/CDA1 family)
VRRRLKRWLLRSLLRLAERTSVENIAALTYHSVDESGSPVSFPESHLRSQMAWLASAGYRSLTATEAAAALSGRREGVGRSVVLTFDDGFRSVREAAFPILSEYGFVGTVFCASGYVGRQSEWACEPAIPALDLMSWADIAFLASQGWEIGAHTVSHASLPELPPARAREETAESRRILQEQTGCEVQSFAYPFGRFDQQSVGSVATAGFTSAWTMEPRANRPGCDLLTLGRFNCDRIRSEDSDTAALAARAYLGGCYPQYAFLTARSLRVRTRRAED